MHCNCQHETTERKCRNTTPPQHRVAARMCPWPVFWHTKFLVFFIPPLTPNIVMTETVHQECTQNVTRGSTTIRKTVTTSHNKLSFSDVGTNEKNRNWNNTTRPGLPAKIPIHPNQPWICERLTHHTTPHHTTATTATQMCPSSVILRTRFLRTFIRRTTCHLRHKTCSSTEPSVCTQTTNRMRLVGKMVYAYPTLSDNTRPDHALDNFNFR